ncbi:MAG: hypothetical protein EBQ79_01520 [Actinobacteria bacterium]|nr:hypothetical protein [Actinomycetota bacterium]
MSFIAESTKDIADLEIQRSLVLTNATLAPTYMLNELPKTPTKLATALVNESAELPETIPSEQLIIAADADINQQHIFSRVLNGIASQLRHYLAPDTPNCSEHPCRTLCR